MEGSIVVGTGSSTSGDTDDDDDGSSGRLLAVLALVS